MKKQLFMCAMATLALCACSNDEIIDSTVSNKPAEIAFSPSVAGMNRAVTTTSSLDQFVVNAQLTQGETSIHYIDNLSVVKENGVWKSAQTYTWPYSGEMKFYAYSPASLNFTYATEESDVPSITYTASSNMELQKDVLYAVNVVDAANAYSPEGSKTVNLNFRHALAQVVFNAKCTNPDWILDITDVEIANVQSRGVYTLPTTATQPLSADGEAVKGSWTLGTELNNYPVVFPDVLNIGAETVELTSSSNCAILVLPQTRAAWEPKLDPSCQQNGAYFLVRCKIQQKTDEGVALLWPSKEVNSAAQVAIPVNIDWVEGKKYTYTFIFGDGAGFIPPTATEGGQDVVPGASTFAPINFSVAVDDFTTIGGNNIEM